VLSLGLNLVGGAAVAADFDKGVRAAQSGDFKSALTSKAPKPAADQFDDDIDF